MGKKLLVIDIDGTLAITVKNIRSYKRGRYWRYEMRTLLYACFRTTLVWYGMGRSEAGF